MDNNMYNLKPCFVTGHPRSGTNLLNKLLNSHLSIVSCPGEGKMHALRRLYHINWVNMSKEEIVNNIRCNIEFNLKETNSSKLIECINAHIVDNSVYKHVINAIVLGISDYTEIAIQHKKIFAEKNHNLEFYFDKALKIFSDPKMIFIFRDPRDIWSSWKIECKKNNSKNDIEQFSLNINLHIIEEYEEMISGYSRFKNVEDLCSYYFIKVDHLLNITKAFYSTERSLSVLKKYKLNSKNYIHANTAVGRFCWNCKYMIEKALSNQELFSKYFKIIKYESVVNDTKSTMEDVARFLEIKFDNILLQPTEGNAAWGSNTSYKEKYTQISSKSIGKHKELLSNKEVNIIEEIFKKEFELFNY